MSIARKVFEIKSLSQTLCKNSDNNNTKMKVLFFVDEYQNVTPKFLTGKLGIIKSNLALVTKQLLDDGLITSSKSTVDKRAVYFFSTEKGKRVLNEYLNEMEKYFHDGEITSDLETSFEKVLAFFNKKI